MARKLLLPALCLLLLASGCVKRAPRPSATNPDAKSSSSSSSNSSSSSSSSRSSASSRSSSASSSSSSNRKCGLSCQLRKERQQAKPEPSRAATRSKPTRREEPVETRIEPRSPTPRPERSNSDGVYHTVKKGETLWRICHAYGADVQEVSRKNGITDPTQIAVGQRIFIPGADEVRAVAPAPLPEGGADEIETCRPSAPPPVTGLKGSLLYPVPGGQNFSPFGIRHGRMHEGLDISAPTGTPVLAADDGKVVYAGNGISAYGNMIIIKHAGNISTVYAHNSKNLVKVGDMVKRGQKIAEVGATGRATGPHCHFEVRVEEKPANPEYYLP